MIPQETVQKVIDTAEIVDVISDFVNLNKSGANYKGLCPFHNERTPSFMVSPAKQIFKCFGCGESGTPVSFLMKHEAMSFVEAVKWLADKYNIEIQEKERSPEEIAQLKENETIFALNLFAQKHFSANLTDTEEGKNIAYSYIKERGFSDKTISSFQIGYSIDKKDFFTNSAIKKGYKTPIIEKAGLITSKKNDLTNKIKFYDRFRARIIFPIHSLSGQIIGFGGRILKKDKTLAKYINSPETPVFNKSKVLYGLFFAKNQIVKNDKCYLVEGYTDVISMHQAGITNVVASSGTSLTNDQIRLIRRFTRNLTLIFDGDTAGLSAAKRGIDLSLKEDMNVRLVAMPKEEDPDSFAKNYPASEVKEYIKENEKDFILFKINLINSEELLDPLKKSEAIKDVLNSIALIPDEIKRDNYIKAAARLLDTNDKIIYKELNKILYKKAQKEHKKQKIAQKQQKQTPQIPSFVKETALPEEKQLIYFLIKFGHKEFNEENTVAKYIINEIENEGGFKNIVYRDVFNIYKENLEKYGSIDTKIFLTNKNEKIRKIVENVLSKDFKISKFWEKNGNIILEPEQTYKRDIEKTIYAFKFRIIEIYLQKIKDEMSVPNLSKQEEETKMKLSIAVQKARKELMKMGGIRNIYKI